MSAAATIIIVRDDFSIPGATEAAPAADGDAESRFFGLLGGDRPDVIVLDLTGSADRGLEAIRRMRERSGVPILVVHRADDAQVEDYRVCGAASCVAAPLDLVSLNIHIRRILELTGSAKSAHAAAAAKSASKALRFAGLVYDPDKNLLVGPTGAEASLTTLENDVMAFLAASARRVCARADIAEALYGSRPPNTDRAIDVIIKRLRTKLDAVDGTRGGALIKTEFRRGYILAADVTAAGEV